MLNFESPLGELEFRRTAGNYPFKERSLDINWDRNEFMPNELLKGEFSLTDESEYLDLLKVSHLGWEGVMINRKVSTILSDFKLQEHKLDTLNVFRDNNENDNFSIPYELIHFNSNGSMFIEKIHYCRTNKRSDEQQNFEVGYAEFIENEIKVPIKERISRKIKITQIGYSSEKFPDVFFDLMYNTYLFKSDFIISEELRTALAGCTGLVFEEGPDIFSF